MGEKLRKIYISLKTSGLTAQAHGIPKIFNSEHIIIKIMWLLSTIGSVSFCIWILVKTIREYLEYPFATVIDVKSEIPAEFPAITICSLNPTEKNYSLSDRIIKCTFNGPLTDCSNDFVDFDFDSIHRCMKFNAYSKPLKIARSGFYNGLVVTIFDGLFNESRPDIFEYGFNGLQVIVYNNSELPDLLAGITVMPGVTTFLKMQKIVKTKLNEPFNHCIGTLNSYHSFNSTLYEAIVGSNFTYRQKNCLDFAFGRSLSANISIDYLFNFEYWSKFNKINVSQLSVQWLNYYSNNTFKDYLEKCPLECNSMTYEISAFQSDYPSYNEYLNLLNNSALISKFPNGNLTSINELKQSLYKIYIYFENLEYTEISQQPQYTIWNLISNIGGLFGLFLGLSLLSFVDLFQIILQLLFIFLEKNKISTKNDKTIHVQPGKISICFLFHSFFKDIIKTFFFHLANSQN